jgi:hypothetical protein
MAEGDPIRIIPHRGVDEDCGSLEVWFADGRKSVRFYWDNLVSRRLSGSTLTREQATEKATALARAEIDKLEISKLFCFANPPYRLIPLPDGQITESLSSLPHKNNSLNLSGKSEAQLRASHPKEGRLAIVTNVAVGCGGRDSYDRRA